MIVQTVYTLALHCPYCGKIEMHDLSPFTLHGKVNLDLVCSCGHVQGRIIALYHQQCVLELPCIVCETNHIICVDIRKVRQTGAERVYCPKENLELGFIGEEKIVTGVIANHMQKAESLLKDTKNREFGEDDVKNSLVMLEVLNRIHDIAEQGGLYCRCGNKQIEVELLPDAIQLRCTHCQGWTIVPALNEQDFKQINARRFLEISPSQKFYHKH